MEQEALSKNRFLSGAGEMGQLISEYDWFKTSLGSIEKWPQSLKITLGLMLHSAFPMFLFWGEDLLCFYNDAYRPSLGNDGKHPAIGKRAKEVWPEIWDFIGPLIDKVINTAQPVWFEDQLVPIFRNGKIEDVWWTFSYSPVYCDRGEVAGMLVTCTETTDKVKNLRTIKENEQQLKHLTLTLEEKVKERTAEIELKNTALQKMNKELESFAYISSHDLQEPLRKIQTFVTRISEKESQNLTVKGKEMFHRMQLAAKRMQTLIEDLLTYSRTNTSERKFETTDLNKIMQEVKEDLKEEIKEKKATIEATELCEANIIPFQFRQMMHNLIGNALKFSNPETPPHIKIKGHIEKGINLDHKKLSPQNKYCHISVIDNGIGFEKEYHEKIFELFQQLHGKAEYSGTGIGLAIVKKIVENHEGMITATSELNKGATFDIFIPAT